MRVFLTGFLVFLAFALYSRWYFICKIRLLCGDTPAVVATRPMSLSLRDGNKVVLHGYEQFGFPAGSAAANLSDNNREFLRKTVEYLRQFPDKNITLSGRFLASEKTAASGIFENIGIARAAAIEQLLAQMGIDEKRISIDYQQVNGAILTEPVGFNLYTPQPANVNAYEKLEFKFTDNTFSDANFAYNSDEFRPGEQCMLYADSVRKYLDLHPEMSLSLIGHTDSIGSQQFNYALGERRAKNAAAYFRELGVKSKINVSSKGKDQPVEPNSKPDGTDNPEGRQKNRRINFKIEENK